MNYFKKNKPSLQRVFGVLNLYLRFAKISWRNIEKNAKKKKVKNHWRFFAYNWKTINSLYITLLCKMKVHKISYKFYNLDFFIRPTVRAQALVKNWRILTDSAKIHFFHSKTLIDYFFMNFFQCRVCKPQIRIPQKNI